MSSPLSEQPDWREEAACLGEDPEVFAVDDRKDRGPAKQAATATAKAICKRCDVAAECLARALELGADAWGTWGGTTDTERAVMQKPTRRLPMDLRPAPRKRASCGRYLGYRQHHDHGERPCTSCLQAKSEYMRDQRQSRAATRREASA